MLDLVKAYPLAVVAILISGLGGAQWLIVYYVRGVRQDFRAIFKTLESHRDKISENSKEISGVAGSHNLAMELHRCPIEEATKVLDKCPLFDTAQ
jgi:hypothetical protein